MRAAAADRQPLCIRGGGTKNFYGETPTGDPLDVGGVSGIVSYAPGELVVTALAGTPLADIEDALAASGQMLAFEPPRHGRHATLGGAVAAGLSGPRRPHAGAVRDFVLGVKLVDGTGESLSFGGQVIKNVAGFDVSRLMCGALGTLGVLTEVSLKCLPQPRMETTRIIDCSGAEALRLVASWSTKPLPISATCIDGEHLSVRLSGARAAVADAVPVVGGREIDGAAFWTGVRDQTLDYFAPALRGDATLWRIALRPTAPWTMLPGEWLVEWGGALRWLRCSDASSAGAVRAWSAEQGGHATLYCGRDRSVGVFHPLADPLRTLHQRLKQTFDPQGILNRGRLYADIG